MNLRTASWDHLDLRTSFCRYLPGADLPKQPQPIFQTKIHSTDANRDTLIPTTHAKQPWSMDLDRWHMGSWSAMRFGLQTYTETSSKLLTTYVWLLYRFIWGKRSNSFYAWVVAFYVVQQCFANTSGMPCIHLTGFQSRWSDPPGLNHKHRLDISSWVIAMAQARQMLVALEGYVEGRWERRHGLRWNAQISMYGWTGGTWRWSCWTHLLNEVCVCVCVCVTTYVYTSYMCVIDKTIHRLCCIIHMSRHWDRTCWLASHDQPWTLGSSGIGILNKNVWNHQTLVWQVLHVCLDRRKGRLPDVGLTNKTKGLGAAKGSHWYPKQLK